MQVKKVRFSISGMNCASCTIAISQSLKATEGVKDVDVNYATEQAVVSYDPKIVSIDKLVKAIAVAGYQASVVKDVEEIGYKIESDKEKQLNQMWGMVVASIIFTLPLVIGSMIPRAPLFLSNGWVMLVLATPVQFWIGWRYYVSAWRAFNRRMANMDTLIALGTSVSYFYSLFVLIFKDFLIQAGIPAHLYFETSAAIITFILIGKYLEMRAKGRANQAIMRLLDLQAKVALKLRITNNSKEWIEVRAKDIAVGDVLLVKPGQKIPADGVVVEGTSHIDQSMVTGENEPVSIGVGQQVIGATINIEGSLQIRATKVGSETLLAKIIEMVRRAQSSRAPVQNLVDLISSYFVPIVIVLSLITFIIWFNIGPEPQILYAVVSLVSVLIIACPCALGLATPTSIMVGVERGALEGILIKDAVTLERSGKITAIIFDKTGTLTKAKRDVSDHLLAAIISDEQQKDIFSMILSVVKLSEHPVSSAIERYLRDKYKSVKVVDFKNISGAGVLGYVDNKRILIGSRDLMEKYNITIDKDIYLRAQRWSQEAKTITYVAVDDQYVALFAIADVIQDGAQKVVERLDDMGIYVVMLTGDNPTSAKAVADKLGIDHFYAQVLPADKEQHVRELQEKGYVVGMVGDGVNDAPALAAADVGIAMGEGTDIAIETAHVTLLKNKIELVPKVIMLSRATLYNITQNLVWAFGYNIILIPIAMGVLYPFFGIMLEPMFAGAAMAFSSLSVVINALRLKRVRL